VIVEIQALRAVAVALVVLYHLWPKRVPGGYVGVDVFFVISGFLITSQIVRQLGSREFSITGFYARRIRRLLPAAFLVLVACALATFVWIPQANWSQFMQEIAASSLYVENWLLAHNAVDYLAAANQASPVQHFWSLSVEEQFYIVWPLLLVGGSSLVGRYVRPSSSPSTILRRLAVIAGSVLAASLAFSIIFTTTNPAAAYFITPTRAWEFAAGGLLSVLVATQRWRGLVGRIPSTAVSVAGLALIAVAALTYTGTTAFPGYLALVPVLGAALVIAGANAGPSQFRRLSSARLIQFIGNISYSIYLWHWVLIAFWPHITGRLPSLADKGVILALTLLLAWATWRFVEVSLQRAPIWTAPRSRKPFVFALVGSVLIVSLAAGGYLVATATNRAIAAKLTTLQGSPCFGAAAMVPEHGCADPFAVTETANPTFASTDLGVGIETGPCELGDEPTPQAPCVFGETSHPGNTVALIGDSHAGQLIEALAPGATKNGWKLETWVAGACPGVGVDDGSTCETWSTRALAQIKEDSSIDTVIVANATSKYLGTARLSAPKVAADLRSLEAAGKRVIVVRDTPGSIRINDDANGKYNVNSCLATTKVTNDPCTEPRSKLVTDDVMMKSVAAVEGVRLIDLSRYFCDELDCHAVVGDVDVYSDGGHISKTYAETLSPYLGRAVQKELPKK
jgi:peptidoglycan/LPS O-acetylase OafA/YrhL